MKSWKEDNMLIKETKRPTKYYIDKGTPDWIPSDSLDNGEFSLQRVESNKYNSKNGRERYYIIFTIYDKNDYFPGKLYLSHFSSKNLKNSRWLAFLDIESVGVFTKEEAEYVINWTKNEMEKFSNTLEID